MTTEPSTIRKASILKVSTMLPTTMVCCRCGAQAWVEVEMNTTTTRDDGKAIFKRMPIEFCAHCYAKHEDKILATAARVVDHREALNRMEGNSDRR